MMDERILKRLQGADASRGLAVNVVGPSKTVSVLCAA